MKVDYKFTTPYNTGLVSKKDNSNVNFGFSMPKFKPNQSQRSLKRLQNEASDISQLFFFPENIDFFDLLRKASDKQRSFIRAVAKHYSAKNYYAKADSRENPEEVIRVFQEIKTPNKYHYFVLANFDGDISNLESILKGIDKKNYKLVAKLNGRIRSKHEYSENLMSDIFTSPYKNEYLKNFKKYASYFALNKQNKNAVSELDNLIQTKKYDRALYDAEYNVNAIMQSRLPENKFITKEFLLSKYSPVAADFMNDFIHTYLVQRNISHLTYENAFDLMHMYETASAKNIELRYQILNRFRFSLKDRFGNDNTQTEITEMRKLFDKIDNSKHVRSFIQKFLSDSSNVHTIKTLNALLDSVGAKKADIFFNNFRRMVNRAPLGERQIAVENGIENPFYETNYMRYRRRSDEYYAFSKPMGRLTKAKLYIGNFINKIKYNITPTETEFVPINSLAEQNGYKPAQVRVLQPSLAKLSENPAEEQFPIKLVSTLKLSPKAKRLKIAEDVQVLISKELSAKTLEKQSESYKANARAMRLKLLPEIFSSIKDTRKVDYGVGKRKGNPAGKDALALYNLISGRNKKLVRYLLVKRNTDNTRMFEVKDIINIISKAENKIKQDNLKAADAKAYYEKLYQAHIQMYGPQKAIRRKTVNKANPESNQVTAKNKNNIRIAV